MEGNNKRVEQARFNPTFTGTYLEMIRAEAEDEGVSESVIIRRRVIESLQSRPPFVWKGKEKEK